LYVARERQSAVKTMQLSNGISNPVGLWCGHLLFDSIPIFVMATLVVILFAHLSHQFYGLGILVGYIILGITARSSLQSGSLLCSMESPAHCWHIA
jgi:hypothetical protein